MAAQAGNICKPYILLKKACYICPKHCKIIIKLLLSYQFHRPIFQTLTICLPQFICHPVVKKTVAKPIKFTGLKLHSWIICLPQFTTINHSPEFLSPICSSFSTFRHQDFSIFGFRLPVRRLSRMKLVLCHLLSSPVVLGSFAVLSASP